MFLLALAATRPAAAAPITERASVPDQKTVLQTDGGLFGLYQRIDGQLRHAGWLNSKVVEPAEDGVVRREHWFLLDGVWDPNALERQFVRHGPSIPEAQHPQMGAFTYHRYDVRIPPHVQPVPPSTVGAQPCSGKRVLCPDRMYEVRNATGTPAVGYVNVFDLPNGRTHENYAMHPLAFRRPGPQECLVQWVLAPFQPDLQPPQNDLNVAGPAAEWLFHWAESRPDVPSPNQPIGPPPPQDCP